MELPEDFLSRHLTRAAAPRCPVAAAAEARRAEGLPVLDLDASEPDFETPANVRAGAYAAMESGQTRLTAVDGMRELKDAVARKYKRDNGLEFALDEIAAGAGAEQLIFNALLATLNPGDQALIATPADPRLSEAVRLAGGAPVSLRARAEDGFKLTADTLALDAWPRAKWLLIQSPSPVTGRAYAAADWTALAEVLAARPSLFVLADESYEQTAFSPEPAPSLLAAAPELRGRVLCVNAVSAAYAMSGWRLGFAAGPAPLIDAMRAVQAGSTLNPSSISQWAAFEALIGPQEPRAEQREALRARRDMLVGALEDCAGVSCAAPEGSHYAFASVADAIGKTAADGRLIDSDVSFCQALLEAEGVALAPGARFEAAGHVRVSFGAEEAALKDACARIQRFCAALR